MAASQSNQSGNITAAIAIAMAMPRQDRMASGNANRNSVGLITTIHAAPGRKAAAIEQRRHYPQ